MPMDIDLLIAMVQDKVPLWDMKDRGYRRRGVQSKLWAKVAREMNSDVESVKKRWKGLRDVFRKEYNKTMQGLSEDADPLDNCTSSWQYFESMMFIRDIMKPKEKSEGSVAQTPNQTYSDDTEDEDLTKPIITFHYENEYVSTAASSPLVTSPSTTAPLIIKPMQIKKMKFDEEYLHVEKDEVFSENAVAVAAKEDSDLQFLLSLLPFLKTVPPHRKLLVRQKLQQVLIDEDRS